MFKYSLITTKLIGIVVVSLLFGCATIFSGTTDVITFTSNTDKVRVYLGGRNVGMTPLTIEVNRQTSKGPMVRFEKGGYESQEFYLEQKFNTVAILDVFSIVTSGGVDVLTGAIMEFSPRQYHVEMISTAITRSQHLQQIDFARFVLLNTNNIQEDLAKGGGEYSSTMFNIIKSTDAVTKDFEEWVADNKNELLSITSPEQFLTSLRSSHMTP